MESLQKFTRAVTTWKIWGLSGKALDPRSKRVQIWNRALLLARGVALVMDPLFVYALSIGRKGGSPCLYMDGGLALVFTVARSLLDAVHLLHIGLQLRSAYVSRKSLVVGCGELVWDARATASAYMRAFKGFWFDIFVILPVPQVVGACWYVLAIQRIASCLQQQCERSAGCNLALSCSEEICSRSLCGGNSTMMSKLVCLDVKGPFRHGIYRWALNVVSSNSLAFRILYPIYWGLTTFSTFGNDLEPTSNWLEVIFSICIIVAGLLLFTLFIGNIQVFLDGVMEKKRNMQLRSRDMEWWMRRRQLPSRLRQRVRHFERERWAATGGEDEMELMKDLPEGLRRDIEQYLIEDDGDQRA
ncbi:cyclic nucleotide-gated ion channel 2-like protein [Trifolium pratense]|uniref:Cyclic nucleotide-gated ion channel 2-like protein n=1 Tax=Trifolium pratense TaxID=57577 RepID=A0A2K3NJ31_TRIPR|nr:cyclic nucleotide-gated ion channel 2-like protein [Trifolium pratense]